MSNQILKGNRVQLLPYDGKYWESVAKWFYDVDYKPFFRHFSKVFNEEELKAFDRVLGSEVFLIHTSDSSVPVGLISITSSIKKNKSCLMGTIIDKSIQKEGIAAEATCLILDYLFNWQGYNKVVVEILESASDIRKTLEKSGWYKEGKLLQECYMDGKFLNELRYSMSSFYYNKNKTRFLKEFQSWVDSSKTS